MKLKKINRLIEQLRATPSTKEKLSILKEYSSDTEVRDFFYLTYASEITLGIAEQPVFESVGKDELTMNALNTLVQNLAERLLTGKRAIESIRGLAESVDEDGQHLISLAIKRSIDAGVSVSTINKVWKELIFVQPYMRCLLPTDVDLDSWDWENGVFVQRKEDGLWAELSTKCSKTRAGNVLKNEVFDAVSNEAFELGLGKDQVIHGEYVIYKNGVLLPRQEGNGIINSLTQGGSLGDDEEISFVAWDLVNVGKTDETPYETRFQALETMVGEAQTIKLIHSEVVHSKDAAMRFYRDQLALRYEGAVLKKKSGIWKSGDSKDQIKLKIIAELDLKIVGYREGTGQFRDLFGSVIMESSCGQMSVGVSGMPLKTRKEIHSRRDELVGTVATIKANGVMYATDGDEIHSLFLPRFVELRKDKTEADSFDKIVSIFESIMNGD